MSPDALQTIPQGDNTPLNQVLLQAPGVAQDSFGQIHLRGEHANVQYRLNGVELPEGLSVFGQAIESRFANSMSLITGALPAQYGFQTAGVVDIQTKTGITDPGLTLSMYGGSWNWAQPSFEYGGRSGPVDWFVTGDYLHDDRGIENPAYKFGAIHDTTNQFHGLAYVGAILDPDTRLSLILGGFDGYFQIPNIPGQPTLGFPVNGVSNFDSSKLNENQREETDFAILSLQKHVNDIDVQFSLFTRYSSLNYSPDWLGDLLFNGIAQQAARGGHRLRRADGRKLENQRPAHAAVRPAGAAGDDDGRYGLLRAAGRCLGDADHRRAVRHLFQHQQQRRAVRRLCAGRMAHPADGDDQWRLALR